MDVYLDTNLWNALFHQRVRVDVLLDSLGKRDIRLVLSDESLYELAKTFLRSDGTGKEHAAALFNYLQEFIARSIPIAKENMDAVAAEMQSLQWKVREVFPFINASDYEIVRTMVEHLATGQPSGEEVERVNRRIALRDFDRRGIRDFFAANPSSKRAFQAITAEQFSGWVAREARTIRATQYIASQIQQYFPDQPASEIAEYAHFLQTAPANRISLGMIRRNIYINWRCAHRGSVPKDLFADSTHIVNANYCDVYGTGEKGQAEYASHLLAPSTRVCIYDNKAAPIDEWLHSLN
jgi:hypothetical protein